MFAHSPGVQHPGAPRVTRRARHAAQGCSVGSVACCRCLGLVLYAGFAQNGMAADVQAEAVCVVKERERGRVCVCVKQLWRSSPESAMHAQKRCGCTRACSECIEMS